MASHKLRWLYCHLILFERPEQEFDQLSLKFACPSQLWFVVAAGHRRVPRGPQVAVMQMLAC
jgi:hypothetical protein